MKGSIGTATHIVYVPKVRKKYKVKGRGYFCIACRGWISKGQWFQYTKKGTCKHFDKNECKKG